MNVRQICRRCELVGSPLEPEGPAPATVWCAISGPPRSRSIGDLKRNQDIGAVRKAASLQEQLVGFANTRPVHGVNEVNWQAVSE